jgi:hypothetical protein
MLLIIISEDGWDERKRRGSNFVPVLKSAQARQNVRISHHNYSSNPNPRDLLLSQSFYDTLQLSEHQEIIRLRDGQLLVRDVWSHVTRYT